MASGTYQGDELRLLQYELEMEYEDSLSTGTDEWSDALYHRRNDLHGRSDTGKAGQQQASQDTIQQRNCHSLYEPGS